jgi:predicted nucleic acid-binding protein
MSASPKPKAFFDSNMWLYAFVASDPQKHAVAKKLVGDYDSVVSIQVINEVCVNLLKKAGWSEPQTERLIDSFFQDTTVVALDRLVLREASRLRSAYSFSYWDSLIVAAALHAGVDTLMSEDLQHKLVVEKVLTVVNPFAP